MILRLYVEKINEINLNNPPEIFCDAGKALLVNRYNLSLFITEVITRTK